MAHPKRCDTLYAMATIRQRIAVSEIVANRGNAMRAMRKANYAPNTVKNPKNLTDSKGFKELFEEYGLTKELVITSLVSDIKRKPKKRVKELSLGADILRLTEREKGPTTNIVNIYAREQIKRVAARVLNDEPTGEGTSDRLLNSDEPAV